MVHQHPMSFNTSLSFSHCDLRHLRVTQMTIDQENINRGNPSFVFPLIQIDGLSMVY